MKKIFGVFMCLLVLGLVGCSTSKNQKMEVDSEQWMIEKGVSVENLFNEQLESAQYINDFDDFLSYNVLSITENKPFISNFYIDANFDENSSIEGGVEISQNKVVKTHDLESLDIEFDIEVQKDENDTEPFNVSGSVSLLYKYNEMYANLHKFQLFMGEGNMIGKMYSLLGESIVGKRIDLEVNNGGVISVSNEEDKKLPYILGTIKNVLEVEDVYSSPNFLGSLAELIDIVNGYVDLGISTNELKIIDQDISYFEFGNGTIEKDFIGLIQGKDSEFKLSFVVTKYGLVLRIFDIKDYDEDLLDYMDRELEYLFSIQEEKKSEYNISFESINYKQKVMDVQGMINYLDVVNFSADFLFEPLKLADGEKISGKAEGYIERKGGDLNVEIPELSSDDIVLFSDILSSL